MTTSNPPTPVGYQLMKQAAVTPAMTAWAVGILNNPAQYPLFQTAVAEFDGHEILARVEWHAADSRIHAPHRGVTLYQAVASAKPPTPSVPTPTPTPAPSDVLGIDVSEYQRSVDWNRAARAGIAFAFIKATEGSNFVDPTFTSHWSAAASAGVLRGAYHFFRPRLSAASQADLFLARTNGEGELPPVLDVETADGVALAQVAAGVRSWLELVTARTGRALVYTSPGFWNTLPLSGGLTQNVDLWVANWGAAKAPAVVGFTRWTFWQFSNHQSVPGVSSPLDASRFNGSLSELHAYSREFLQHRSALLEPSNQQSA